jgi:hypothetical protein
MNVGQTTKSCPIISISCELVILFHVMTRKDNAGFKKQKKEKKKKKKESNKRKRCVAQIFFQTE